jgi:hypothetical protein
MKKKLGLILMAVVLALGALGVSYAMWYEDLFIDGTVTTGNLDVGYYCSWGDFWDTEPDGKDVSYITKAWGADDKSITFTIVNAYPCIDYYGEFCLNVGAGSIPVHFGPWLIDRGTMPASATIEVTPDLTGAQRHAGSHTECTLHVHLDNPGTEMGANYTFSVKITGYQYNESPY